MTDPMAPELISAGVKEVVAEAARLGISWQMRLATVTVPGQRPLVIFDGDTAMVPALSLVGSLRQDQRVMVTSVPPGLNVVMGLPAIPGTMLYGEASSTTVSFTSLVTYTETITFSQVYPVAPNVHANINSGAGATSQWHARCSNVTTADFLLILFGPSATFSSVNVQWTAIAKTS